MTEVDYREELLNALEKERKHILSNINSFFQKIPSKAIRVNLIISPDQKGEGQFCIHGGLNGLNLYHLNKKVEAWTNILEVKTDTIGFNATFPIVDPSSIDYNVNDIIAKICSNWINDNWDQIDDSLIKVGIAIYSDHI